MKRGRLALVTGPELDYCTVYHCPGDCGQPHNQDEREAYAQAVLDAFGALAHEDKRETLARRAEVERLARRRV